MEKDPKLEVYSALLGLFFFAELIICFFDVSVFD